MKPQEILNERTIFGEFSHDLGKKTLQVRIYREYNALVCERALIERDGSTYTQTLAVRRFDEVANLLQADPYYLEIRPRVEFLLNRLAEEMCVVEHI